MQESVNAAGDKVEDTKDAAKEKYDKNITDNIATNPVEEAKAQGEIPANTAAVKSVYGQQ